jgi:hypothetical protein
MARRLDPDPVPTRGDSFLVALIAFAGATFVAAVLWLLLGAR